MLRKPMRGLLPHLVQDPIIQGLGMKATQHGEDLRFAICEVVDPKYALSPLVNTTALIVAGGSISRASMLVGTAASLRVRDDVRIA